MKLLYHLSYDEESQPHFQYTDCVTLITDMLLLSAGGEGLRVMIALCINLATNKVNAQQMADNSRLHSLMSKALANQDCLIMKMLRNIAEHEATRTSFIVRSVSKKLNQLKINLSRSLSATWRRRPRSPARRTLFSSASVSCRTFACRTSTGPRYLGTLT